MAMALTTLANVKAWLFTQNIQAPSTDDALLSRLILAASRTIYSYINLDSLFLTTVNESVDGGGNCRLFLWNWPAISITSLYVDGSNILPAPPQPQQGSGYRLEAFQGMPPAQPQALDLYGRVFTMGRNNVYVTYQAGYCAQGESHVIPNTPYQVTANQTYGTWGQDDGVVSSSGTVFTAVTGAPAAGEYNVTNGIYTFNSADSGTTVLMSYSYIPYDVEQACIEIVSERYRYKERIGMKAKTLAGQETATYDLSGMTSSVKALLQSYKRTNIV
jgi:hypothetical protein